MRFSLLSLIVGLILQFGGSSPGQAQSRIPEILQVLPPTDIMRFRTPTPGSSINQDIPERPAIPTPNGPSQPPPDPRCQGLTEAQRRATPGCQ